MENDAHEDIYSPYRIRSSLALPGSMTHAATVYTGNKVQGVPVISTLDVSNLPAGQHRFMFEGLRQERTALVCTHNGGKRKTDGKKVLMQAGVHGMS